MRLKLGFTTLALAGLLAVGAVAGVALGSPARQDGLGPIKTAFDKSSKAGSAKFSFSLTIKAKSLSARGATITGNGAVDTKQQVATFTINLGPLSALAGAAGAIPSTVDGVLVDGVVYFHVPGIAQTLGKGKEWLKVDPKTLPSSTTGGVNPGSVQVGPSTLTHMLSSVSVHRIGSVRVRGTQTTKYRTTVNVARVVSVLPTKQRGPALKSLRKTGIKAVAVNVYVSGNGYVRRVTTALGFAAGKQGRASIGLTLDFYDYGTTVTATAPPASKTADAGPLLAQLLGSVTGG